MNSKAYKKISKVSLDRNSSYVFKYLVIGDNGVGKSGLIQTFLNQENAKQGRVEHLIATSGVNFHCRSVRIQDQIHKLYLWDTSGQECFRSITEAYFKGTACIFLVYDITNRKSFINLNQWLKDAKYNCNLNVIYVLVGNKSDLEDERVVTQEEAYQFADENDLLFFETSARTGENVQKVFMHSSSFILDQIHQGTLSIDQNNGVWRDVIPRTTPPNDRRKSQRTVCSRIRKFVRNYFCCCLCDNKK